LSTPHEAATRSEYLPLLVSLNNHTVVLQNGLH
jgi:hypothetical protein